MVFVPFRESQVAARKALKIRAFGVPKGTSWRAGSLENTVKHVSLVKQNDEKQWFFGFETDTK